MKVDKKAITEMLKLVDLAVVKKGDDTLGNRVVFTGRDLAGFSDDICFVYPFETDFIGACPANELIALVAKCNTKEVEFIFSKGALNIKGGTKLKARLKMEDNHPYINDVGTIILAADQGVQWHDVPQDFTEGLRLCMYSTSKDVGQPKLACVHINGQLMVGSDDFRISEYTMAQPMGHTMLIPGAQCAELVKLGTITKYGVDGTWGYFTNDDYIMGAVRLTAGEYGDHKPFFDQLAQGTTVKLPCKKIINEVGTASIMADGELDIEKNVGVTIEQGKVTLRGEKDIGFSQTTISDKTVVIEKPVNFGINPAFLSEVLERTDNVEIIADKALFTSDDGSFRHLVSLSIGTP